jgi:hypothetical protein
MHKMLRLLAILALVLSITSTAMAEFIIDTGGYQFGTTWSLAESQGFGAKFTVDDAAEIDSVQGFIRVLRPGNLVFAIHSDQGAVPGDVLFSATESYPVATLSTWQGASNLGWNLSEGTYWLSIRATWISFEKPIDSVFGFMPGGAPHPAEEYALYVDGAWWDRGLDHYDYLGIGVRISAVPEPSTYALGALALVGLIVFRRRSY